MKPLRLVLADDHSLVRAGVRSLLQTLSGIEVVAEASNGREVLTLIEQHHPDVVMMDISMPEVNGLDALARIVQDHPGVRVIMLSMHATEEYVWKALRSGAAGYLLKDAAPAELELALRCVAQGGNYISPSISKQQSAGAPGRRKGDASLSLLTPRQREVLQRIAEGNSTKEMAAKLHVSVKTVETHRMQLMERLGIWDVAGLVRYAIRVGLVTSDS
jgi:DNA-binding NarL/FixJ family response regulator